MKILRLDLIAFGPFDGLSLDLSAGDYGLHMLYGPNEAGKSSALRALQQFFYGFEAQTPDNFRHAYDRLRIGALLRHSDGSEHEFVRRKGNKNTLRGPDDSTVIDPGVLDRFLGGVTEETFQNRFGINHAALLKGGEEILKQNGELGQLLFAVGSGVGDLHEVRARLRSDAEELLKEKGRIQKIPELLNQLSSVRKQSTDAQLPLAEWQRHEQCLLEARGRKETLEQQRQARQAERNRLSRFHGAIPMIARRTELLTELDTLRGTPVLPEDFGEQCRKAPSALQLAEAQKHQAEQTLGTIVPELEGLVVPEELLAHADDVESLYRRLGEYQKGLKDLPERELQRNTLQHDARTILRRLGRPPDLDQADSLRLRTNEPQKIRALGNRLGELEIALRAARKSRDTLIGQIEQLDGELVGLEEPREVGGLRQRVERVQRAGALEEDLTAQQNELHRLQDQVDIELARLPGWSHGLDQLVRLPAPGADTIARYQGEIEALQQERKSLRQRIDETAVQQSDEQRQLRTLELHQEVPTEAELHDFRQKREADWRLVRRSWLDGVAITPGAEEAAARRLLAADYERTVADADQVADRLRREAERVARKADLLARQERLATQHKRQLADLADVETQQQRAAAAWAEVCVSHGLPVLPPPELKSWLEQRADLVRVAGELEKSRSTLSLRQRAVEQYRADLRQGLRELGVCLPDETQLSVYVEACQEVIVRQDKLAQRRERLVKERSARASELMQVNAELDRADADLTTWRLAWKDALDRLGLTEQALPDEANAVLEDIAALFQKQERIDDFDKRIKGLNRDREQFEADARRLAQKVAQDLESAAAQGLAQTLHTRLTEAREAKQAQKRLQKQRTTEEMRRAQAEAALDIAKKQLDGLCDQAGCQRYAELPAVVERAARRRQCQVELQQIETQLLPSRAGTPLDQFIAEALQLDPDRLDPTMRKLDEAIAELDGQIGAVDQTIGAEKQELDRMDGRGTAAAAAERAEGLIAVLHSHVEQYVTLRLATTVLQRGIERYRDKNQGPILEHASRLLDRLTGGSLAGLRIDSGANGEAVLVGVRPDKELVRVAGMSDGSRDQLYLALRLASLEVYLRQHEPIPFIVDDLLLNFDNARAGATLAVLADLAQRTQVIFFTHHEHLVDLARRQHGADELFVHQLPGRETRSPEARG